MAFILLFAGLLTGCGSNVTTASAPTYSLVQVPQQGYSSVYALINSAKTSIDMTMYAFDDPSAQDALIAAAKRGVDVRVMFDSNGQGAQIDQPAYAALKAAGVHVAWAWGGVLWHQKSIVVDNAKVLISTANLDAQYYPVVRGFLVTTNNPATVSGIVKTFNMDYSHLTSALGPGSIPSGSQLIWAPGAEAPLETLIGTAKPGTCLLYTSPSPRDRQKSRMPSSA